MLDDAAVDGGDVERAVGAGAEHGGTKPVVARGEELAVLFVCGAVAGESDAVRFQDFAVNHVLRRLADKDTGGKSRTEQPVAIRRGAVGGSQIVGCLRPVEALLRPADGKDACRVRIVGQDLAWFFYRDRKRGV